jgi:hypothetical protein
MSMKVIELNTPKYAGEVKPIQVDFLKTVLETEDQDKMSFHVDADALEYMKDWATEAPWQANAADIESVISLLQKILGHKVSIDITYDPADPSLPCQIHGSVVDRKSPKAVFAAKVKGYLEIGFKRELLGSALTDENGNFVIYHQQDLQDVGPDAALHIEVEKWNGHKFEAASGIKTRNIAEKVLNLGIVRI